MLSVLPLSSPLSRVMQVRRWLLVLPFILHKLDCYSPLTMDKETEMSQVDAVSSHDHHSEAKEDGSHLEEVAPQRQTFPRKLKQHLRKWWWLHLILFIAVTLLLVMLLSVTSSEYSKSPWTFAYIILASEKTKLIFSQRLCCLPQNRSERHRRLFPSRDLHRPFKPIRNCVPPSSSEHQLKRQPLPSSSRCLQCLPCARRKQSLRLRDNPSHRRRSE